MVLNEVVLPPQNHDHSRYITEDDEEVGGGGADRRGHVPHAFP